MLLEHDSCPATDSPSDAAPAAAIGPAASGFEAIARRLGLARRAVRERQQVAHAGQPVRALWYVHAGCFKTTVASADGREKITGFRTRGDFLGLDALGADVHACDVTALDTGELWEIPAALYRSRESGAGELRDLLSLAMAAEIRRDWQWMLSIGTLGAEARVTAFLLDLAARQQALGYSARQLTLRMTRAELGNFLDLTLETVTRVLSRLAAEGMIDVQRRDIRLLRLAAGPRPCATRRLAA